eukprot:7875906-Pyramimonas_sp.AAC.2
MPAQGNGVCFATDINPLAVAATQKTLAAHGVHAEVVVGDLLAGMENRLAGRKEPLFTHKTVCPSFHHSMFLQGQHKQIDSYLLVRRPILQSD